MPITPFPTLFTAPVYRPGNNTVELTVSNFFYENPKTGHSSALEVWLGDIGPLQQRVYNAPATGPLTNITSFHGQGQVPIDGHIPTTPDQGSPPNSAVSPGPPRYIAQGPVHTNVIVEMPPIPEIVKALQAEARRMGNGNPESAADGSVKISPTPDPSVDITGRTVPLLFIRGADGIGYHSGRTVACENLFQGIDLNNPQPNAGGPSDATWLAAAQAAASADGGLHGWTLRVL